MYVASPRSAGDLPNRQCRSTVNANAFDLPVCLLITDPREPCLRKAAGFHKLELFRRAPINSVLPPERPTEGGWPMRHSSRSFLSLWWITVVKQHLLFKKFLHGIVVQPFISRSRLLTLTARLTCTDSRRVPQAGLSESERGEGRLKQTPSHPTLGPRLLVWIPGRELFWVFGGEKKI